MLEVSAKENAASRSNINLPVIVWFRDDLRVTDNPALWHARKSGRPLIALFILDGVSEGIRALGGAQKWWLHHALENLAEELNELGSDLTIRSGPAREILAQVIEESEASVVFWNRRYGGSAEIEIDKEIKASLEQDGIEVKSFRASLLHEPTKLQTGSGTPYRVYSPFWRALQQADEPREPFGKPDKLNPYSKALSSENLADLKLLPEKPDWAAGLRETWDASEEGANRQLTHFLKNGLSGYAKGRDMPADDHVSRLSPYLRFGLLSPFQIWYRARESSAPKRDVEKFLKEIAWREFSYHLLFHFPEIGWKNFNERFDDFPWREESDALGDWQRGRTGYPIVDAGMRELWHTGYMHNRVRMVVASFLVKHLLIHWRRGEEWFWDTLVDGDPANNSASWQWVAGSGADAAPYFRVFNPILQGKKFDPAGEYVRRWVPEIAGLPDKYLHEPWEAPEAVRIEAGLKLGGNYPVPVIDHAQARKRALAAFDATRKEESQ